MIIVIEQICLREMKREKKKQNKRERQGTDLTPKIIKWNMI